jgi:MoxR-like ATPase
MAFNNKPKPAGYLTWNERAALNDEQARAYFVTVEGQSGDKLENSLKFLRNMYGYKGNQPAPVAAPATPANQPKEHVAMNHPAPVAAVAAPAMKAPAAAGDAGLAAMAAMLAPFMAPAIESHVQTAIALVAQAAKAPVLHVHVAGVEAPMVMDGLHHHQAAKVIKLARPLSKRGLGLMMVGPAGCGKTSMAATAAKAYGMELTVISCSAGMSEGDLLGKLLPIGEGGAFVFVEGLFLKAYREGHLILIDEMDAADANLLLVLNSAIANGFVTVHGLLANGGQARVERHPDTVIMAAANTWGAGADTQYVGRAALDAATLDRFHRMYVDYCTTIEEAMGPASIVARVHIIRAKARAAKLRQVVSTRMIIRMAVLVASGLTLDEATADELAPWSQDERAKVAA